MQTPDTRTDEAFAQLEQDGLLLLSDARLPSLTALIAGAPIRGSWWGHPSGDTIFQVANLLAERPDVLLVKLVDGKVTFVHRALWPALVAVGSAREPWQLDGLSSAAETLLARVDRDGGLRVDALHDLLELTPRALSEAAGQLETRLLVHGEQLHSDRGKHTKYLETWDHWIERRQAGLEPGQPRARAGLEPGQPPAGMALEPGQPPARSASAQGKQRLEAALEALNQRTNAAGRLPWMARAARKRPAH